MPSTSILSCSSVGKVKKGFFFEYQYMSGSTVCSVLTFVKDNEESQDKSKKGRFFED